MPCVLGSPRTATSSFGGCSIPRRSARSVPRSWANCRPTGGPSQGATPSTAPPVAPVRAVRMADLFGDWTYTRIVLNPDLNRIAYRSRLADTMRDLLGPSGFCYPLRIPRIVYPSTLTARQPGNYVHKDYRSVQDMFTCWVPFGHVPAELGGLALCPEPTDRSRRTRAARSAARPVGDHGLPAGRRPRLSLSDHTRGLAEPQRAHAALGRVPLATGRPAGAAQRLVIGPTGAEIGSRLLRRYRWWRPVPDGLQLFDEDLDATRSKLPAPASRFVPFF